MDDKMYGCDATKVMALPRLADGRLAIDAQGQGWKPWNKVLRYLTQQEQVDLLLKAFDDYPDLLKYAFHERGWIPAAWYEKQAERAAVKAANRGATLGMGTPPATGTAKPAPVAPTGTATPAAAPASTIDDWGSGSVDEGITEEGAKAGETPKVADIVNAAGVGDFGAPGAAAAEQPAVTTGQATAAGGTPAAAATNAFAALAAARAAQLAKTQATIVAG
jgi:hypothetical protein